MRIVWKRDFDQLLEENLTQEERAEYKQSFRVKLTSFEDMGWQSDVQIRLFLKAFGCRCFADVSALRDECMRIIAGLCDGDVLRYEKVHFGRPYRMAVSRLTRKWARKKKCHVNAIRSFVCYCDQHNHPTPVQ